MNSYAQFETDLHILSLFPDGHIGNYIDIGANHPINGNNTYVLYENGWRGICIEPTGKALLYPGLRPGDRILKLACGQHDGPGVLFEHAEDSVSTLLPTEAEKRGICTPLEVIVTTLATVLRGYNIAADSPLDVLSIDVEGYEKEVLEGCPFESGFRPKVIAIEACEPCTLTPSWGRWHHILEAYGYQHVKTVGVNRLYVHETFSEKSA